MMKLYEYMLEKHFPTVLFVVLALAVAAVLTVVPIVFEAILK